MPQNPTNLSYENRLAAHAAALFCADIIVRCFTAHANAQLSDTVVSGLQRNQNMLSAWELVETVITQTGTGEQKIDTAVMSEKHPQECIELAEMFAQAMLTSYGSEAALYHNYKHNSLGRNMQVHHALMEQAPTLSLLFNEDPPQVAIGTAQPFSGHAPKPPFLN